ncbi:hypothetical protein G6F24_012011 [Rhizopus arrhizus]|nr:hypothetical protein G6F24_012011 [Rhizopus arrhizus]
MGRWRGVVVDQRRAVRLVGRRMAAADTELGRRVTPAQIEGEDGHERGAGDGPQPVVLQGTRADAMGRLQHDGGHRRLDAVEDPGHQRHVAEGDVEPGQDDQDQQRRQHEQHPGDDTAPSAVQQPADVGGQLLGLRPGQQHAVVQCVEETPLGNPAPPLHQFLMHDRDLPGRPAEADEAELEPEQQGLPETDGFAARQCLLIGLHNPIEDGAGGIQQLIVVFQAGPQAGEHPFHTGGLGRLGTAYVEVMHQCCHAPQTGCLQGEAGLQGLEGDAVADVAEARTVEVEAQGLVRPVVRRRQPEDACRGVDEAPDQPGTGQAVDPGPVTRGPDPPLELRQRQSLDLLLMTAGLVPGQRATDRDLQLAQPGVGLLLVHPGEEVDVLDLGEGLAQFSSLAHDRKRGVGSHLRELCLYLCTQLGVVLRTREQRDEALTLRVAYRQQADITLAVENVALHRRQDLSTSRPVRQQARMRSAALAVGNAITKQSQSFNVAISQSLFDLYTNPISGEGEAARSTVKPETRVRNAPSLAAAEAAPSRLPEA